MTSTLTTSKAKFAKGDLVRNVSHGALHYRETGTVDGPQTDSLSGGPRVWVIWDRDGKCTHLDESGLELICRALAAKTKTSDFQIGDTIRNAAGQVFVIDRKEKSLQGVGNFYAGMRVGGFPDWDIAMSHDCNGLPTLVKAKPVPPLKLEEGAIVRIKDGVDEWEVSYKGSSLIDARRGKTHATFNISDVEVVKGKPKPKPAYYTNVPGDEPKDGDVFVSAGQTAQVHDGYYTYLSHGMGREKFGLKKAGSYPMGDHARESSRFAKYARTLVARDNEPVKVGV